MAPALDRNLSVALQSREERGIKRRIPPPSQPSSTPSTSLDFSSNDYLSLSTSPILRARFLSACTSSTDLPLLGSGGSRLLINPPAHADLEARLARFFHHPAGADGALLFNSGYDANVSLFSCIPHPGDVVLADAHVHASVHDGVRAARIHRDAFHTFAHNSAPALRALLGRLVREHPGLADGAESAFVAVESVYSMDGSIAPLAEYVRVLEELLPRGNGYLIVDEAHATGVFGPQGRGIVAEEGLEGHPRVLARLHTFGKALAGTGAILLTPPLVRTYLVNYARPLIYTTALAHANVIAANCAFDLLEDGTAGALAAHLLGLAEYTHARLHAALSGVPMSLLALPPNSARAAPIIPLMTPAPHALAAYLAREHGIVARPIAWPTVARGEERVRVCLRAGHARADVDRLVRGVAAWAEGEARRRGNAGGARVDDVVYALAKL